MVVVISFLRSLGPVADLSQHQLSHRGMAFVLMILCHQIGDWILSGLLPSLCVVSNDQVVLQCAFGLKQDRLGHASPVIQLQYRGPRMRKFAQYTISRLNWVKWSHHILQMLCF